MPLDKADSEGAGGAAETLGYDADLERDIQSAIDEIDGRQSEDAADGQQGEEAEKAADVDGRARDERGRFAKKEEEAEKAAEGEQIGGGEQGEQQAQAVEGQQPASQTSAPPVGWSVKSKGEWDKLPEHIRADIAKREEEVNRGFQQYAGLGRYREMAERSGTTLERALENYVGIEQKLRANPVDGFIQIAQNMRVHPVEIAQQIMAAYGHGAQPQLQPDAQAQDISELYPELAQVINPLQQQVQALTQQTQQFLTASQQREQQERQRIIDANEAARVAFANDPKNRYYANVEPTILKVLKGGLVEITGNPAADLAKAYELACHLDPEVRAQIAQESAVKAEQDRQAKEREAAAKAKAASRQITGSAPSGDLRPAQRRNGMSYEQDLEADVLAAVESIGGRV